MLTQYRNDLVKAVAAVNKNVIVVGELAHERFAVALLGLMLIYWGSSQRRTNHPRIDLVERQRTSHRVGWVSVVTESTSRSLLTNHRSCNIFSKMSHSFDQVCPILTT